MSAADVAAINAHTDAKLAAMDTKINHIVTYIDGNKDAKTGKYDRNGAASRAQDTLSGLARLLKHFT